MQKIKTNTTSRHGSTVAQKPTSAKPVAAEKGLKKLDNEIRHQFILSSWNSLTCAVHSAISQRLHKTLGIGAGVTYGYPGMGPELSDGGYVPVHPGVAPYTPPNSFDNCKALTDEEKSIIEDAMVTIYQTYRAAAIRAITQEPKNG